MSDDQTMMPIAATRREVAAQPEVIARVLAEQSTAIRDLAQRLALRATRQIVLLGSGDSWFAGLGCLLAFETYSGLPAEAIQAYEYAAYGHAGFDAATAVIVISSSGRPTTTWDALERALLARRRLRARGVAHAACALPLLLQERQVDRHGRERVLDLVRQAVRQARQDGRTARALRTAARAGCHLLCRGRPRCLGRPPRGG